METKRCPYCHKVQRVQRTDAQVCSRCGRTLLNKKSGTLSRDESRPSNLPASPHRAGHYAGLHPEDQPYQSNKMAVQRPSLTQDKAWHPLHEPEHIVLPPLDDEETLPAVSRQIGDQVQQLYPSVEKGVFSSFVARPVSVILALACLFFLLASSIIAFALIGKSSSIASVMVSASPNVVRVNDTFTLSGQGFTGHRWLTFVYDFRHPIFDDNQKPLQIQVGEDGHFRAEIRVSAAWGTGHHFIYVIDDAQNASISTSITVEQESASQPHLQLAMNEMSFGLAEAGVVSDKMLTLLNTGGGQLRWQTSSDQPWLTASPGDGTFSGRADIQIQINRSTLAPGTYTGRMAFVTLLPGTNANGDRATALTLRVTMAVDAPPATLSVSTNSLAYSASPLQNPGPQSIVLQNSGDQSLDWNGQVATNDGAPWLAIYPAAGRLSPGASASLIVSAQAQKLAAGSYQGTLIFSSGGQIKQVAISLSVTKPSTTNPLTSGATVQPTSSVAVQPTSRVTVQPLSSATVQPTSSVALKKQATIAVSPETMTMQKSSSVQTNVAQVMVIKNTGSASLHWQVMQPAGTAASWLSVDVTSGTLDPGQTASLNVSCKTISLAPGTYTTSLLVSDRNNPDVMPQKILITAVVQ